MATADVGSKPSTLSAYLAVADMVPKTFLIFSWAAWVRVLQNLVAMVVFVYFWRAVYADTATVAGLSLTATLSYILLARIFQPLSEFGLILEFGWYLKDGGIAMLMVRPLDMQLSYYGEAMAKLAMSLLRQVPAVLLATLAFGLRWPTDPAAWMVFVIAALLGHGVIFCLDWMASCITIYTNATWGLWAFVGGIALFFTGALLPLDMMPEWLRLIAVNTPFAQAVYVPIALLTGLAPLQEAPRLLLGQFVWLAVLVPLSRLVFNVAARRITVQGG
jgi:ABC-2 type transport system permease protein